MKTPQELFDHTVRHLAKQGRRAVGNMGLCALRSSDGKHSCAIGCHIPYELYKPEMEGQLGALNSEDCDPDQWKVLSAAGIGEDSVGLMMDLQRTHDGCDLRHWHCSLRTVGHLHGLAMGVFDEPAVKAQFAALDRMERG